MTPLHVPALIFGSALTLIFSNPAFGQDDPADSKDTAVGAPAKDEVTIRANIKAYVDAYTKKDAKALAAFWSKDGQFVSPISGESMRGRENIEKEYTAMFADGGDVALEVAVDSLRFITGKVAVEDGTARVIYPGELPIESQYQVIHRKQGGKWLIDSVRETVQPTELAAGDKSAAGVPEMKELGWMIGDWLDDGDTSSVYLSCSWGLGMNFIKSEFNVAVDDRIIMGGIEIIGWDPEAKSYRSWVFDSEGGFGSATWTRDGDTWTKQMTGTTKTGQRAFAAHTILKVDDDTYKWRAHGRELDGEPLPNIDTVTVIRQSGGQ